MISIYHFLSLYIYIYIYIYTVCIYILGLNEAFDSLERERENAIDNDRQLQKPLNLPSESSSVVKMKNIEKYEQSV